MLCCAQQPIEERSLELGFSAVQEEVVESRPVTGPCETKFPMWVAPAKEVLESAGPLPCHEELRAAERLQLRREDMSCVMISHQWLGVLHPDPVGAQVETLRRALRNLASGAVVVEDDATTQLILGRSRRLGEAATQRLLGAYVWMDWMCIPQGRRNEEQEAQYMAAVLSIPSYVQQCEFFVALCPPLAHTRGQEGGPGRPAEGERCDLASYRARGWCRMELAAWRGPGDRNVILVQAPDRVCFYGNHELRNLQPGSGDFSIGSDKPLLYPVVESIVERRLAQQLADDNLYHYRLTLSNRAVLLAGFLPANPGALGGDVSSFLAKYRFDGVRGCFQNGLGPVACAALEGDCGVLDAVAHAGADVNAPLQKADDDLWADAGATPLHLACLFNRSGQVVEKLIDARAAMETACLRLAAHIDASEAAKVLLSHGVAPAELSMRQTARFQPVAVAAALGRLATLDLLLERRADANAAEASGASPLRLCALHENVSIALRLLKAAADPNRPARPLGAAALSVAAKAARRFGFQAAASNEAAEVPGSTPLHAAASAGREALCEALLRWRADARLRSDHGRTPADCAKRAGHEALARLLLAKEKPEWGEDAAPPSLRQRRSERFPDRGLEAQARTLSRASEPRNGGARMLWCSDPAIGDKDDGLHGPLLPRLACCLAGKIVSDLEADRSDEEPMVCVMEI